ncbi:MAG TPA: energy-coupling factor transporter transmembrane component T [Bacteroidales bacterium]|nr:energy-coupling factor transporter transmembrane component T [Bacteroidales bacterium]HPS17671.1 energy-coupling factor transporter transmembrane component T [Bacteroidales bacterium]
MENKIPSYLLNTEEINIHSFQRNKLPFIDRTIHNSAKAIKSIYTQAENASKKNIINEINPKIKFISLLYIAIVISLANNIFSQFLLSCFILLIIISSNLNILNIYKKILFIAFIFGLLVTLPASLNVITPGKIILNIFSFSESTKFWIYHVPENIGITMEGLGVVALFFLRVLNSVSFALLIVFTTSFPAFIKSFKIIGIPDTFLMIISLAYKFIFILSKTIEETYMSLKSRLFGNVKNKNIRRIITGRIHFIYRKSNLTYEQTYQAMLSRGYMGKIKLISEKKLSTTDYIALSIAVTFGIFIIIIG